MWTPNYTKEGYTLFHGEGTRIPTIGGQDHHSPEGRIIKEKILKRELTMLMRPTASPKSPLPRISKENTVISRANS